MDTLDNPKLMELELLEIEFFAAAVDFERAYYRKAKAIADIYDSDLWVFKATNWDRYVPENLGMTRRTANRYIEGYRAIAPLVDAGMTLLPNAGTHARALGTIEDTETRKAVWSAIEAVVENEHLPTKAITADAIISIAEVAQELKLTGAFTVDGESVTALSVILAAAQESITEKTDERRARASQHRQGRRLFIVNTRVQVDGNTLSVNVPNAGEYEIRVWKVD